MATAASSLTRPSAWNGVIMAVSRPSYGRMAHSLARGPVRPRWRTGRSVGERVAVRRGGGVGFRLRDGSIAVLDRVPPPLGVVLVLRLVALGPRLLGHVRVLIGRSQAAGGGAVMAASCGAPRRGPGA